MKITILRYFTTVSCFCIAALIFAGCGSTTTKQQAEQAIVAPAIKVQTVEQIKFTPSVTNQKIANIKDVFKVYNKTKGRATGIYEHQGIIYVIVNVNYGKEKNSRRMAKGTAMLRSKKMLQNTYKLPSSFKLRTHQLEAQDIYKKNLYRYAFVCYKSDINKIITSNKTIINQSIINPKQPVVQKSTSVQPKQIVKQTKTNKEKNITVKSTTRKAKRKVITEGAFCGDADVRDDF